MPPSLPVLLYHYVNDLADPISVHPEVFERHLRLLSRAGYTGVGLEAAGEFLTTGRLPARKPVLLTFDDGFLDNYTHAWPLLQKYGHQAVIFAVTGRIESGPPRPTLKDVWSGAAQTSALPSAAAAFTTDELGIGRRDDHFFSWPEARLMEASAAVRVAAHSHAHSSVFASPHFSGVLRPRSSRRSLDRIAGPAPWGLPKFAFGPFFAGPAYLPSQEILDFAAANVPQDLKAAVAFFADKTEARRLAAHYAALPAARLGRFETPEEFRARVREELGLCAATLERELGHPATALAWPWGAGSETALQEAERLGITLFFDTTTGANVPGVTRHVNRFKARNKGAWWLHSRLAIHGRPWLARLYRRLRV